MGHIRRRLERDHTRPRYFVTDAGVGDPIPARGVRRGRVPELRARRQIRAEGCSAVVSERTPPPGAIRLAPTKISPPQVDDRLERRERLDRLFDGGDRVVVVVAPAGFGKTVAVSQWAQHVGQPVAWYTVDEHDRTAARFWRYLAASLGRAVPRSVPRRSGRSRNGQSTASTWPPCCSPSWEKNRLLACS